MVRVWARLKVKIMVKVKELRLEGHLIALLLLGNGKQRLWLCAFPFFNIP